MAIERNLNKEAMKEAILDDMNLEEILQFAKILEIIRKYYPNFKYDNTIYINNNNYRIAIDLIGTQTSRILIEHNGVKQWIILGPNKNLNIRYEVITYTNNKKRNGISEELLFEFDLKALPTQTTLEEIRESYMRQPRYFKDELAKDSSTTRICNIELSWCLIPSDIKYNEDKIYYGEYKNRKFTSFELSANNLQVLRINGEEPKADVSYNPIAEQEKVKKLIQDNSYGFSPETLNIFNNMVMHAIEETGQRKEAAIEEYIRTCACIPQKVKELESVADSSLYIFNNLRFAKEELANIITVLFELFEAKNIGVKNYLTEAETAKKRVREILKLDSKTLSDLADQLRRKGY